MAAAAALEAAPHDAEAAIVADIEAVRAIGVGEALAEPGEGRPLDPDRAARVACSEDSLLRVAEKALADEQIARLERIPAPLRSGTRMFWKTRPSTRVSSPSITRAALPSQATPSNVTVPKLRAT
jgi:hypothetical protein